MSATIVVTRKACGDVTLATRLWTCVLSAEQAAELASLLLAASLAGERKK